MQPAVTLNILENTTCLCDANENEGQLLASILIQNNETTFTFLCSLMYESKMRV